MFINTRLARRAVIGALGTGAVAAAMFAARVPPRRRWPIPLPIAPPVISRR